MDGRVGAKGNEVEKIGDMNVLIKSKTRHYGRVIGLISSLSLSGVFFCLCLIGLERASNSAIVCLVALGAQ